MVSAPPLAAHGAILVLVEPLEHLLDEAIFKAASIFSLLSIFLNTKYMVNSFFGHILASKLKV